MFPQVLTNKKNTSGFTLMNYPSSRSESAFTLIELLIVVTLIAALAAFVTFTFPSAQKRARDTTRKSDLSQYRNSLETFANRTTDSLYPSHTAATSANTLCGASDLNLTVACPTDPKNGTNPYGYFYRSDGGGGITATKYILYAYLEYSNNYFALCSNGTTITKASAPTLADCP